MDVCGCCGDVRVVCDDVQVDAACWVDVDDGPGTFWESEIE